MACRLFGTKPLSQPLLVIVNWTLRNKLLWIFFYQNTKLFIHENASRIIVCGMAIHSWKCIWNYRLRNGGHFVQGEISCTGHGVNPHCGCRCSSPSAAKLQRRPINYHWSDVMMGVMASQITTLITVYTSVYSSADQRKKIKALRHWSFCGEFTGDRWIPRTNGQ